MKNVVGSQGASKLKAVEEAWRDAGRRAEVVGSAAKSGMPEQPVEKQGLQGARNRARHALELVPDAECGWGIENYIYKERLSYYDRAAVVALTKNGKEYVAYSDPVKFPTKYVREARRRGFSTNTVGQVMAEAGYVRAHDDPHLDISGRSRLTLLREACLEVVDQIKKEQNLRAGSQASTSSNLIGRQASSDGRGQRSLKDALGANIQQAASLPGVRRLVEKVRSRGV